MFSFFLCTNACLNITKVRLLEAEVLQTEKRSVTRRPKNMMTAHIVLKKNHPDTDKMYQEHLLGLFWGTPRTYFSSVISHLGKTTAIFQIVQSGHNYLSASHDLCSAAHCPSIPSAMLKTLWLYKYRYETCNNMKTLIMYKEMMALWNTLM